MRPQLSGAVPVDEVEDPLALTRLHRKAREPSLSLGPRVRVVGRTAEPGRDAVALGAEHCWRPHRQTEV